MGIPEIEDAGCLLCFGYNGADSHPIVARRIVRGRQKGMKIICADPRVTEPIQELCAAGRVPVEQVESMKELGEACGIEVSAAVVALL